MSQAVGRACDSRHAAGPQQIAAATTVPDPYPTVPPPLALVLALALVGFMVVVPASTWAFLGWLIGWTWSR